MIDGNMNNQLIVIENGKLSHYNLNQKDNWSIGRISKNSQTDILLDSDTVSRNHGTFSREEGYWFYMDHSKNGTIYNGTPMTKGLGGRTKSIMLEQGDVLVFGSNNKAKVTEETAWAFFCSLPMNGEWKRFNYRADQQIFVSDGTERKSANGLQMCQVLEFSKGILISLNGTVYWCGDLQVGVAAL